MDHDSQWRQQRGTLVGVVLAGIMAAGIISFSFLACGGFAIYATLVVVGFTALGCFHYLLWGRGMMNEVAEERRAEEMRRRLEAEAWPSGEEDEPHDFRRF
jgi:hypothetical protein